MAEQKKCWIVTRRESDSSYYVVGVFTDHARTEIWKSAGCKIEERPFNPAGSPTAPEGMAFYLVYWDTHKGKARIQRVVTVEDQDGPRWIMAVNQPRGGPGEVDHQGIVGPGEYDGNYRMCVLAKDEADALAQATALMTTPKIEVAPKVPVKV